MAAPNIRTEPSKIQVRTTTLDAYTRSSAQICNLGTTASEYVIVRKGELLVNMIKRLDHRVAQPPSCWVHSDNVYGDPGSLSDARLKTEVTSVSGAQALSVLSQIQGCTYERADLNQRRLGLIADVVEEAIDQLAIDNVVG